MHRWVAKFKFISLEAKLEFKSKHRPAVVKFSILWCIVQCFIILASAATGLAIFGWAREGTVLFVCQAIALAFLILLALVMRFVPKAQPYAGRFLCIACVSLISWTGWMIHCLVGGLLLQAETQPLSDVWQLLAENPKLQEQLHRFLQKELSGKLLLLYLLFNFFTLDLVRFLGSIRTMTISCLTLPAVFFVTTFLSPVVSNDVPEILAASVGLSIYAFLSSLHIISLQRKQFELDYALQQALVKEAEMMKQAKEVEVLQRQASQKADSALSHILKNLMADAVGCIDLALDNPSNWTVHLQRAVVSLQRGMQWCKRRQVMQGIMEGTYIPNLVPIQLSEFGDALIEGLPVTGEFSSEVVLLDPVLMDIVADNAISNALRHGDPAGADVRCKLVVDKVDTAEGPAMVLKLLVTNRASPGRPKLTKDYIAKIINGEVCRNSMAPAFSDQLGLQHLFLAAQAHGMMVTLEQEGNIVALEGSFAVRAGDADEPTTADELADVNNFPEGVRILCVEDSDVSRRLLVHSLNKHVKGAQVQAYGKDSSEVDAFMREALKGAEMLILDQHLEYEDESFLGTDLIKILKSAGFSGFICVRSANVTDEDLALYFSSGAHHVIGKDIRADAMVNDLKTEYVRHCRRYGEPLRPGSPRPGRSTPRSITNDRHCVIVDSDDPERASELRKMEPFMPGMVPPDTPNFSICLDHLLSSVRYPHRNEESNGPTTDALPSSSICSPVTQSQDSPIDLTPLCIDLQSAPATTPRWFDQRVRQRGRFFDTLCGPSA